ncbi:hypothetical protein NKH54_22730 [Mesorhizobium sp. M1004]|uniref:hypothetical protein n=1 Tax=Mesorhizobium sp. M1004 TaxID=2957046 RepID=UPI003335ECCA
MASKNDKTEDALAIDTQAGIFPQFRRLWNGGEHRRAADLAKAENLSEAGWAALHDEFPQLLEVINQ